MYPLRIPSHSPSKAPQCALTPDTMWYYADQCLPGHEQYHYAHGNKSAELPTLCYSEEKYKHIFNKTSFQSTELKGYTTIKNTVMFISGVVAMGIPVVMGMVEDPAGCVGILVLGAPITLATLGVIGAGVAENVGVKFDGLFAHTTLEGKIFSAFDRMDRLCSKNNPLNQELCLESGREWHHLCKIYCAKSSNITWCSQPEEVCSPLPFYIHAADVPAMMVLDEIEAV